MPRVFVEQGGIAGDRLRLAGPDAHYLLRVMRLKEGDAFVALDGAGGAYEARIVSAEGGIVEATLGPRTEAPEPPMPITLYQGLPKGDKWELVIQKATELGATRLVPVAAARSVVQLKGDKVEAKRARWGAIAKEAAEQCERGRIPEVTAPMTLKQVAVVDGELALVLSERVEGPTLPRALPETPPGAVSIFIGPEGGWAPEELALLRGLGVQEVSLGRRILRTETAGLTALALVMAAYEL